MEKNCKELPPIGILFSRKERNLQEHQSECLALRSSGRINSSMTIKTNFLLIEVISSLTQHPSTSHTATLIPGQKQYALQVVYTADWFCQISRVSPLQALLMLSLHSKTCRIFLFESSRSQRSLTEPD